MRYDAEHKEKTRKKVLRVAANAIRAEGPHKIAVAGIMAQAGLTHGGFYAHFASKDDLVVEAIGQMFEDGKSRFDRSTEGRAPAAALSNYIDFYLSDEHRVSRSMGCPLAALSADLPRLPEAARERFSQGVAALTRLIAGKLAELGRPDADELGASMIAELVGSLSLARAVSDDAQAETILNHSRQALKARLGLEALS
ncbi:TetR/AcrR family transcriptional regulator [soil metagenome]